MSFVEDLKVLTENLRKVENVMRINSDEWMEEHVLALALNDINESCKEIAEVLLPKLLNSEATAEEVETLLVEVGEELRHILYHIYDTRYYSYLQGNPSSQ